MLFDVTNTVLVVVVCNDSSASAGTIRQTSPQSIRKNINSDHGVPTTARKKRERKKERAKKESAKKSAHMKESAKKSAQMKVSSVPLVYCVTNKKTKRLYKRLFEEVNAKLREAPKSCMSDFELAAFDAAREVWPNITVNLCHFHMAQSVFRRIQKCNDLLKRYQTVDEDRIIMKSLANLAFVPTRKVYEAFCALWDEASDMDPLFRSFFRTYIGKDSVPDELIPEFTAGCGADAFIRDQLLTERSRGVTYPPALWNLYERTLSGESRTNNSMEGWHSSIRRCFAGKPQMTTLLTRIKSEQEYAMQSLREFRINPSRGLRQRPQRYRYRLQNDHFMEIVSRWGEEDGNGCVEYLRRLALHSQSLHPSNTDPGEDCDDDAENAQDTSVEAT
ncbi:hypothetical protein QR680_019175 [Steinernema hermaphroditum]|uniref:MULE transposase domain-containing protein n=1 Tax=Steinernema hermaphroditum TaxID=289476 RepID=A0AA39HK64_9BILA|nr:hypothetical protein QR680_019175 [Steinernema hermaphroditum]